MSSLVVYLADEAETLAFGKRLADACLAPCLIFLSGNLGAYFCRRN